MSFNVRHLWNTTYDSRAMVEPLDFTKQVLDYIKAGDSILDIGCGDGRDALYFSQNGLNVTAIDLSDTAIERVKQLDAQIDARVMDTTAMDFPDAYFDAVYAHLSLHYFDDATTVGIFENIHRILKPGGHFLVRCKSTKDSLYGIGERIGEDTFANPHVRHFFTERYMRSLLGAFDILKIGESSATYENKKSAFIEAIAIKGK